MPLNFHLARLLQLVSPLLPVGAYSYSQGLEWAVEDGMVHNQESAAHWIDDILVYSMGRFEAPIFWRMLHAWQANDFEKIIYWNELFCSSRETAELRAETLQMGYSLHQLLVQLENIDQQKILQLEKLGTISFPVAFSFVVNEWQIPFEQALQGYLWSWLENQVSAALKSVPLGQVAGQKILAQLGGTLAGVASNATHLADDELSNYCPALAIISSRHETQYSRLFRS